MKYNNTLSDKIMKKFIVLIIVMLAISAGYSQSPGNNAKQKLEAARIALITERLGLTPSQAQEFWPIYNEYAEQRRSIQRGYREARQNFDMQNLSEEQGKQLMKIGMETKQKALNLEKEYSDRMIRVVSAKQLVALRKAEEDFRSMIIRRLEQRKQQQLRQQDMLRQREKKIQQGNN
jgi:acyl transferase domain-containing protein